MSVATGALLGLSLAAVGLLFFVPNIFTAWDSTKKQQNLAIYQQLIDPNGPDIQFVLFTRNNTPRNLQPGDIQSLNLSGFKRNYPTKIITHGFMSSLKYEVFTLIKDAFLQSGDYNIFGMDWSALCKTEYSLAMRGAKIAGQNLADFINFLTLHGVKYEEIHLIGHSLGAHVAGLAADNIEEKKIGRITGLDPAGPGYGDVKEKFRLDPADAKIVEVLHTFMRVIGTNRPSGHLDFYPNGGKQQPGCPEVTSLKVTDSIFCNHGRSYELFAEAIINPKAFKSFRCSSFEDALNGQCMNENYIYLGQIDSYRNGLYYFQTSGKSPFSLNPNLTEEQDFKIIGKNKE